MSTGLLDKPTGAPPPANQPIQVGGGNAMWKVSMRGLMAHKMRFFLTLLAVTLGTAFVAGSFVLTNALGNSIDGIVGGSTKDTDVVVQAKEGDAQGLPLSLDDTIRKASGVAAVEPALGGSLSIVGSDGKVVAAGGAPTQGFAWTTGANNATAQYELTDGRAPSTANEIAINDSGLEKSGLKVGDSTQVALPKRGLVPVTVVGSYKFDFAVGGYIGVAFTPEQAKQEFLQGESVREIYVRANDGVSQSQLRDDVAAVLPATAQAETQQAYLDEIGKQVDQGLNFLNTFLLVFGIIGLVVGASLIYITFSMVIAQRLRELALLRAIGSSRGQILRSVLAEGFIVGLVGSVFGVLLGWALGFGLLRLLGSTVGVPLGAATLPLRGVLIALVLGVAVTVISAIAPAIRAGSTSPIEAMGGQFATPRIGRVRVIVGVLLLVAVVGLSVYAVTQASLPMIGVALFLSLVAILVVSPVVAPLVFAVFRPLTRLTPVGRLAHGNTIRNPKRTAATAAALAVGLALISGAAVVAASAKATLTDAITKGQNWSYVVMNQQQGQPLPPYLVKQVDAVPADAVLQLGVSQLPTKDGDLNTKTVRGDFAKSFDVEMVSGSDNLGPNTALVTDSMAKDKGWKTGDTVDVASPAGTSKKLTIGGIMKSGGLLDPMVVNASFSDAFTPAEVRGPFAILVTPKAGADLAQVRSELDNATKDNPLATVQDKKQFAKTFTAQVDVFLGILYGLLGLAVAISILGIVNTLALSVVERVREVGMMRAIGAQRAQIRRMVTTESVLICTYGALIGLGIGVTFGWLFMGLLRDQGLTSRVIPWGQIGIFFAAAVLVGLIAAIWPAFKAARTRPLEAIAED